MSRIITNKEEEEGMIIMIVIGIIVIMTERTATIKMIKRKELEAAAGSGFVKSHKINRIKNPKLKTNKIYCGIRRIRC